MNDMVLAERSFHAPMTAATMRSQVNLIQEVMGAVMKENVHYGKIPGTDKPTLYKSGAEVLAATFHIAPKYRVEELSNPDVVRYRVVCIGVHQGTGIELAEGLGECSSNEEKYKWRKASSNKEFDTTPLERRRVKYGYSKKSGGEFEIRQVRTEPADVANTILKMAAKRAQVAMTLNSVAASDIFTQDIEDLPEEYLDRGDDRQEATTSSGQQTKPVYPNEGLDKNMPVWQGLIEAGKKTAEQIIAVASSKYTLTDEQQAKIRAVKPVDQKPHNPHVDPPIKVTFAQAREKLEKAADVDLLDAHADLLKEIEDAEQRDELTAFYKQRRGELTA